MLVQFKDLLERLTQYNEVEVTPRREVKMQTIFRKAKFTNTEFFEGDNFYYWTQERIDYDAQEILTVAFGKDEETGKGLFSYVVEPYEAKCKSNAEAKFIKKKIGEYEFRIDPYVEMIDGKRYWEVLKVNEHYEAKIKELKALL